jgi:hypothetical protein
MNLLRSRFRTSKQITLNQRVQGSSPCAPTSKIQRVWRREIIALTTRGNPWGNGSAAWCDELEPHTGKGAGGQERRLALSGIQPIDCNAVMPSCLIGKPIGAAESADACTGRTPGHRTVAQRFPKPLRSILSCILLSRCVRKFGRFFVVANKSVPSFPTV